MAGQGTAVPVGRGSAAPSAPAMIARRIVAPVARWTLPAIGTVLGGAFALVESVYLVGAGLVFGAAAMAPPLRRVVARGVMAGARVLVGLECRRLTSCFGHPVRANLAGAGMVTYLTARSVIGLVFAAVVLAGLFWGLVFAAVLVAGWGMVGPHSGGVEWPMVVTYRGVITPGIVLMVGAGGLVLLYVTARCALGFGLIERRIVEWFLPAHTTDALKRRIVELTTSRADVVEAVNQERRRIERDLHDGVQQRMVALAMLLGRARRRRSQEGVDSLLRQAHVDAQEILDELREVAWSVYPNVLDVLGLDAALTALAERSAVPVRIFYDLASRPPAAVEAAAYFVVCEALNNAVKHAAADTITVRVGRRHDLVEVVVRDDGIGGADPTGGGLVGLARRVAALDGRLVVDSPVGGPTAVIAELPCG